MPPLAEYHGPDTQGPDTQGPDVQAPLLSRYEALLALTEQMLSLAADHAWDELIAIESDYVSQVAALDSAALDNPAPDGAAPMASLDADERQRLGSLLEAILVNDLALREKLVHRRDELGELLKVSRNQQDLHRAYAGGRVVNAGTRFRRETP
ncbi:flagellar protein FliT [Halomonas sp. DN3]|uniref:flagellar protein FliT n=1 Tax=Halomonas sp. DN3 TaxID=2953657 RepID=UPI00209DA6DA|nr:flagellar protein FliT [Halomonas sp. DN3]USZ49763.1 flagellar protein FliT [Halomonas sp. DN3]